ncbi:MAG: hypothetical protein ACUVWN_14160 [bacterium]
MEDVDLWKIANKNKDLMRFSTLFTAQDVRDRLSNDEGLKNAIEWCKKTAVTHVYIESFRDGYRAERKSLEHAKSAFLDADIDVSGCVTTTNVGKKSTGWNIIACYTDISTQQKLQEIFEYTASIFDEIMIDDFLFTDCECDDCKSAKGDRSWSEFRNDLMVNLSRVRILKPAKLVNPNVKIIIKYPQWYDNFHNRGYEVVRETQDFDKIWVGTETRDPDNERWGRKAQYEAYYIMRWLGVIGGNKTGGGWYDPYGTSPPTYVEQARQTVLADAKESLLFCYGSLLHDTGPANVEKLRTEIPALFELAKIVRGKPIKGILAPKPPNSEPYNEQYIFDFVGMLGLPLVPEPEIRPVESAFFSVHALKDPGFLKKLKTMIDEGKPLLITDGLKKRIGDQINLDRKNVQILEVNGKPNSLLNIDRQTLLNIRNKMLKPFGITFDAPNKVSLYLIGDDCVVIENFNDVDIDVQFHKSGLSKAESLIELPIDSNINIKLDNCKLSVSMSPRSMVALKIAM